MGISRREQGLTLIELIVVLAILSVLASVAIPNYMAFRKRTYEAEAKQCLGEIRKLSWVYFMENGSFPNMAQMNNWGWGDPQNAAYEYTAAPPSYFATPVAGGPADGMKTWTLTVGTDGSAILQ